MKGNQLKKLKNMPASRLIALGFLGIILVGTLLLMLPVASRDGQCAGFLTALFTAASSTCVTGLIVADTWVQWSGFGQLIIIIMIQIGGLGFMSILAFMISLLRQNMNLRSRMVLAESIGVENMDELSRVAKRVIICGIGIEIIGGIILSIRFLFDFDFLTSVKLGFFHSISAFCNAGFDILGFNTPGQSLIPYATDPTVCITVTALVVLGGLGFLVWDEVLRNHSPKKWSAYTKLVLITSAGLLLSGWVYFLVVEWNNPATLGPLSTGEKIFSSLFQSMTVRTAGFAGLNEGAMSEAGKCGAMFLMLIGGSSASTAGGLKTVTFVIILLFLISRIRGKQTVSVFQRTVPEKQVLNALTLFSILICLAFAGTTVLCIDSGVSFVDSLFECISALATVGLTTGITPTLGVWSKILLIVFMYFGRVGILTLSIGFLQQKPASTAYKYAEAQFLIG